MRRHARSARPAARTRGGFSMLEMVIATGILSFGLLSLGLMQLRSLTESSRGRHTGDAAAVARSYIEQAHRIPWTLLDAAEGAGFVDPSWVAAPNSWSNLVSTPSGGTATEQTYGVQWSVADVGGDTCLRDVQIQVTWNEEGITAPRQLQLSTRRYNFGDPNC